VAAASVAASFEEHCAACHGTTGAGDGPFSPYLVPGARDFGEGRFLIVSTDNGVPSDADLAGVIARGLPGTGMPGFAWLGDERLAELARHVRGLAERRAADLLVERWSAARAPMSAERAAELAAFRMQPGEPLAIPEPLERVDEQVLARGREVWLERCSACHGADGAGRTPDARWAHWDVSFARDLRAGLLKGGAGHDAVAARILAGMPGAAMPGESFRNPDDLRALLAFVRELLPTDAATRGVTEVRELDAARRSTAFPDDGAELADAVPLEVAVWLSPIARRPESVLEATVGAAHDGERIAIHVRWADATQDSRAIGARDGSDAAALQFAADPRRPSFGMGDVVRPADVWHWAAFRPRDVIGAIDLLEAPHGVDGSLLRAEGLVRPEQRADRVHARGADQRQAEELDLEVAGGVAGRPLGRRVPQAPRSGVGLVEPESRCAGARRTGCLRCRDLERLGR
jgi:mono/diheme cytochrome c family protein